MLQLRRRSAHLGRPASPLCVSCLLAWNSGCQQPWRNPGSLTQGGRLYASTHPAAKRVRKAKRERAKAADAQQLKLWKETLDVLKDLQSREVLLPQGEQAAGSSAKEPAPGSLPEGKKDGAQPNKKDDSGQVEIIASALSLLKTVLSVQRPAGASEEAPEEASGNVVGGALSSSAAGVPAEEVAEKKPVAEPKAVKKKEQHPSSPPPALPPSPQDAQKKDKVESEEAQPPSPPPKKAPKKRAAPPSEKEKKADKASDRYKVNKVNAKRLHLDPVETKQQLSVPNIQYGLDRALFNPGVYHLQDPRSRVYNFDPYLATIMPIKEFDFNALKQYVTSSKDTNLMSMAAELKKKYTGSTSSMTSMLSHFHFLLSCWRPINPAHTSRGFQPESYNFTRITRAPAATFLHWRDGVYAIDADKEFDTANILSMLGKSMEKLLTLSKDDFEKYRITKSHQLTEEERNAEESFHYTTFQDFLMRSQLDAHDSRLPGKGMFDLKTRAVVSIRMDAKDFQRGLGYEIRNRIGQWESFEREYYDMIRSAFLKYSLQVRMGRMDGIYVAYHNTQRIFGFQYISINEMDLALHGTEDRVLGDREFKVSLHLLNAVLDKAIEKFPGRSLRLHVETRPSDSAPFMYIFAKPVDRNEIEEVQTSNRASVEAFERDMLGLVSNDINQEELGESEAAAEAAETADEAKEEDEVEVEDEDEAEQDDLSRTVWEAMRLKVEETIENEARGADVVRDTIEDALEDSGLLRARSPEETRSYIDALLEAITSPDTEKIAETIQRNSLSESETVISQDAESQESGSPSETMERGEQQGEELRQFAVGVESAGDVTQTLSEAAREPEPAKSTESMESQSSEQPVESNAGEASAEREVGEGEEAERQVDTNNNVQNDEAPSPTDRKFPSSGISLKDLIIKLAAQVGASQARESGSAKEYADQQAPVPAEAPKNKRFERILSEMMASAKGSATPGETSLEGTVSQEGGSEKAKAEGTGSQDGAKEKKPEPTDDSAPAAKDSAGNELLGMILTIRNKVNGEYVQRPENYTMSDSWTVEYAIEEIPSQRAHDIYAVVQRRRKSLLSPKPVTDKERSFGRDFMQKLRSLSAKGRRFREVENQRARERPVKVYGVDRELKWDEVFTADGAAEAGNEGPETKSGWDELFKPVGQVIGGEKKGSSKRR